MGKVCKKLISISSGFYNWIFPKKIEPPECVIKLLEALYPKIDWSKVNFYDGLPWFVKIFAPATSAITLPGTYNFVRINIYFKNFNPCDCNGLSTIVHEAFHVLQFRNIINGFGIGFFRLFMIDYLACWIKNGYNNHPMEIAAEEYEKIFRQCCNELQSGNICECDTEPPTFNELALEELLKNCGDKLIVTTSGFSYNCGFFPFILGFILTLLIAIIKPLLESIFLIVDGLLWIITGIVCAIEWLINLIAGVLQAICKWVVELEKKCTEWATTTIQKCKEYRDEGYNACAEYQDQGYNACSQYQDQGYNACSQYQDQGYNACSQYQDQGYNACSQYQDQGYSACSNWAKNCCTWWPCSWACQLFTWICVAWYWVTNLVCITWYWVTNLVCIAWYWVTNLVCVAWYWVTNLICVAWYWVTNLVCVAWYWVANLVCVVWVTVIVTVCKVFTWVIKKITCI